ncbi:MAG: DUF2071 domain-containing protein [Undibacterium sp.]|nr:DUF2071 domain-containing protein [Opitutaceae bacterium]
MSSPTMAQRLAERVRPEGAPVMRQRWAQLLFLHWAWDAAAIQRTLPAGLTVDLHEGRAWVGLVPFFMERVRPRGCPAVPGISDFLELNVRTYVHDAQGRPGVWFYSLDANQWLAVKVARTFFHLPYEHAEMSAAIAAGTGEVDYRARRAGTERESRFVYRTAGDSGAKKAEVGSLEFFLVERYRLFAQDARREWLFSGRVHHEPYRIGAVEVPIWDDAMLRLAGFECGGRAPDHVCGARAVDVEVWPLGRVAEPTRAEEEKGEGLGGAVGAPA